jgi:hypothetical protein
MKKKTFKRLVYKQIKNIGLLKIDTIEIKATIYQEQTFFSDMIRRIQKCSSFIIKFVKPLSIAYPKGIVNVAKVYHSLS